MKKIILSFCAALLFCMTGHLAAQTVLIPSGTGQKQWEERQMEAFQGLTDAIPYQKNAGLSAYTDLSKKMDFSVKMRPLSENAALQKAFKTNKRKGREKASTADLAIDTTLDIAYWGMLSSVEDGKNLFVTMEYLPSPTESWYYSGITYTFFDENLKPGKSFSIKTPASTQDISIMGRYSTRFFNYNAQNEFLVSVHSFAEGYGPAACRDTLLIVNEDGEILRKFGHTSGALLHSVTKDGSTENRIQLIDAFYSELGDTMKTFIYKAMDVMQDNPEPLYTFKISETLTTYSNGALAAFSEIEGEPCYLTMQYKKPFVADGVHDGEEIVVEKDNSYEVYIYDIDFNLVKKITLPLFGLEENEFSFSTLMYFGKYMITRHVFNRDDKYELIYGMDRYDISCDCNKLQFYLVDEDGKILKEIVDDVASVIELQPIIGENDEFALAMGDEDAVTGITMLDVPSLDVNFYFPALYKNELLSMNFERIPAAEGGYNYVFGLGRGENADGTVYGGIVHYDRQGEIVKRVRIDLGSDCLLFTPIINNVTMNPYAFIPDEKQEYLYFYRFSRNGAAGPGFGIANEDETLYKWQENDQDGVFSSAGILTNQDGTMLKNLYVSWERNDGSMEHIFYKLPLKNIELQGEGTESSPYIITSPGELDMVRNYPEAWFVLGNDIDMASFTGVNQSGFIPIPQFKGNFDGKGHFISNITLHGSGIFKEVNGGTIANLSLRNVVFSSTDRADVGAIAGTLMMNSRLTNCHVESDFEVTGSRVGGLVGQAVNSSVIDRCSFTGCISGASESIGGIVGDMRTSGTVSNSYVKGSVSGKESVGGIVGTMLNGAMVDNSYALNAVYASAYMAGGIVGENSGGQIRHTYTTGKIEVDTLFESKWFKGTAGGIAGSTVPNTFAGQIKYSFALNDTVTASEQVFRVAGTEYYMSADSVKSLDSNYALVSMKIGARNALAAVNDANCVKDKNNGESGSLEAFNQAFYEKNTWRFGNDSAAPWKMTGSMPTLWWEYLVRGVELSSRHVSVAKGGTVTLTAAVIPADAVNTTLLWNSDAPQVATVDQQGVVTGRGVGKAVVTVKTPDGVYEASCEVTVIIPVEQVIFSQKEMFVPVETTLPLSATVLPEDATNKTVLYQSMNNAIAMTGGPAVYGVEVGTTQIVAVSEQSGVSDTCTVHVVVPITGIVLNENNLSMDKKTPTFQLEATVYPSEAAGSPLVWKSDDTHVAEVSNTGLVYARDKGETTITASSFDGKVSALCFVTVTEFVSADNENGTQVMVNAYMADNRMVVTASCGMEWLKVYNLSGQCVVNRSAIGADKVAVDAAKLPQGLYLLQIGLAGGKTVHTKMMR